jgi:TonB-dependent starch-binding outer membrane protein SusC
LHPWNYKFIQENTVTGRVTESGTGLPLPGVTIMIRGTSTGTVTDVDGFYEISNVTPANVLVFSYVGMRTQEVIVGSLTEINIELENEALLLDEIVAIGYGTARKSDITGSVYFCFRRSGNRKENNSIVSSFARIDGRSYCNKK